MTTRKVARASVAFGVAASAIAVYACSADLRHLNGCRAIASAACERSRECNPSAFSAAYGGDGDACTDATLAILGKGIRPSGNDACGEHTTACLDEIERAPCSRTTLLRECGMLRTVTPGGNGSTAGGDGDGGARAVDGGNRPDGGSPAGDVEVLEVRGGVAVICSRGDGCRTSTGETYGGGTATFTSFAVDRMGGVYGVSGDGKARYVTPEGDTSAIQGTWDAAFTVPDLDASYYAALVQNEKRVVSLYRDGGNLPEITRTLDELSVSGDVRGLAHLSGQYFAVQYGASVFSCGLSNVNSCNEMNDVLASTPIRGEEGVSTGAFVVVAAPSTAKVIGREGVEHELDGCAHGAVVYSRTVACVTATGTLRVGAQEVTDAKSVARVALDATDVHWVTTTGAYEKRRRTAL